MSRSSHSALQAPLADPAAAWQATPADPPSNETGAELSPLVAPPAPVAAPHNWRAAATAVYRALTCRLIGHSWRREPALGTGANCFVCAACQGLIVSPDRVPARSARPMTEAEPGRPPGFRS